MSLLEKKRRSQSTIQLPGTFEYIVKDNDTLRSIAAHYDVNLSTLKEANKLMTEIIFPDQLLYIPTHGYSLQRKLSDVTDQMSRLRPGHAERQSKPAQVVLPPKPLSTDELAKIDEECHHMFVKMQAVYLIEGLRIPGVLLATPDGVMFDPDLDDPVVLEKGADEFRLVDSIKSVISVSVFHNQQLINKINETENKEKDGDDKKKDEVFKDDDAQSGDEGGKGTSDKSTCLTTPVYIRLKVHTNIDSFRTFKDISKHKKLQHWFSVPCDRNIDQLFAFFTKWPPSLVPDFESEDYYFKEVETVSKVGELIEEGERRKEGLVKGLKLSKDWQMVNIKEYRRLQVVLEVQQLPPPELSSPSLILTEHHLKTLACNLPALGEGMPWSLSYSSDRDGFSLQTLYRKMPQYESIFILLIKDTQSCVFGALLVGLLKVQDHFEGSGESHLFTFHPEYKRFNWTGINNFFFKGNSDSLVVGASEGNNGLWLDGELFHGRTQECQTFDNEVLTSPQDFVVRCLEVWTLK